MDGRKDPGASKSVNGGIILTRNGILTDTSVYSIPYCRAVLGFVAVRYGDGFFLIVYPHDSD